MMAEKLLIYHQPPIKEVVKSTVEIEHTILRIS